MTRDYLFVDENLRFSTGEDARLQVARVNDLAYLQEGRGVVQVPRGRWEVAQTYERNTWLSAAAHAVDDRNEEHASAFLDYQTLRGQRFTRAIEVGCGPFTNLRMIARSAVVDSCVLLDPLLESYLDHRHCTFRDHFLRVRTRRLDSTLGQSLVGRAIRRVLRRTWPRALAVGVPVERLIPAPVEELQPIGDFDLVVMINVIEHCFDAERVFEALLRLCRPGCTLVFHDRLFDPQSLLAELQMRFDAGHPLRVSGQMIETFLARNFETRFERYLDVADAFGTIDLARRGLYYIGQRRR